MGGSDSQEEVMIFRDKHTNKHCIIIYISSSSTTRGSEEDGAGGSELVYSPHSELDYGTFLCFGENSIGR